MRDMFPIANGPNVVSTTISGSTLFTATLKNGFVIKYYGTNINGSSSFAVPNTGFSAAVPSSAGPDEAQPVAVVVLARLRQILDLQQIEPLMEQRSSSATPRETDVIGQTILFSRQQRGLDFNDNSQVLRHSQSPSRGKHRWLRAQENVSAMSASNHLPISLKFFGVHPSEAANDRATGVMTLAAASY